MGHPRTLVEKEEEDAAKFASSLAELGCGSGFDRKLVFRHSHRHSAFGLRVS